MPDVVEEKRTGSINWGFWVKLVVAGAIFGVIIWKNDWAQFWQEMRQTDLRWFAAAGASFILAQIAGAFRWKQLLRVQGISLKLGEVWSINMVGFFFNQFLFGSTGGDLIKVFYAIRKAPDRKAAATLSMVMDRVFGLIAILAVTFMLLPVGWEQLSQDQDTRLILIFLAVVLGCIFCGMTVVFLFPLKKLPAFFHQLWLKVPKREIFESLYDAMHAHGREMRYTWLAVAGAVMSVVPLLSVGWLLAQALSLDIQLGPMTILFAMLLCAISVPLMPGGHGVREAAFILLFGVFGVTRQGEPVGEEAALVCSTLFLAINLGWALVGGVVYLFFSSHLKKTTVNM